ncbi:hypothetical protein HAX54_037941, partial [Datura stramonium]|nr:hypothetical protein [Datura stramonium]
TMASHADKEKEVVVADKGLKRLRKGTKGSKSSTTKVPLLGGSEKKTWRSMGLGGLMPQKKQSMILKTGLIRASLHLSSLPSATLSSSWD